MGYEKPGQPTLYKPEYCQMLINHMKTGMSFWSFAGVVGVAIDTLSEWCRVHPEFSEAKTIGRGFELQVWETIKQKAAMGIPLEVPGVKGKMRDPNPTLIIFSLKNKFPKLYRDKIDLDANHTITNTLSQFTEDEKSAILKAALEAKQKKQIQDKTSEVKLVQNEDIDG